MDRLPIEESAEGSADHLPVEGSADPLPIEGSAEGSASADYFW